MTNDALLINSPESEFNRLVNEAFKNYDSLPELSGSPLADSSLVVPALILEPPLPDDRGRALRGVLRWVANRLAPEPSPYPFGQLRPPDDPTWASPLWWRYNILRHHYLEPLPLACCREDGDHKPSRVNTLIGLMGISSEDNFFDERNRAIREAARFLRIQLTGRHFDDELRRMALEELYESLPPPCLALLELAAIFRGPFPQAWLIQMATQEHLDLAPALSHLIANRLLIQEGDSSRLRMPAALQKYAYARQNNVTQIRRRHESAVQFYQEYDNPLQLTWHLQRSSRPGEAAAILFEHADELINEFQSEELLATLLEFNLGQLSLFQWCNIQLLLSDVYHNRDEHEEAILACRRVIRATKSPPYQARSFHRLGKLHENQSTTRALEYYCQAAERFNPEDPEWPDLLRDRAWLYIKTREWEKAEADLNEALKHINPAAPLQQANLYDAFAGLYQEQKCYETALLHARNALACREGTGDLARIADSCNDIGNLYLQMECFDQAHALFEETLNVRRRLGNPERIADTHLRIGMVYYFQGNYREAVVQYREGLRIYQEIDRPGGEVQARYNLVEAYAMLNSIEEAAQHWKAGFNLSRQMDLKGEFFWFEHLRETFPALNAHLGSDAPESPPSENSGPSTLRPNEQKILALVQQEGYVTPHRLQQEGLPKSTITRLLNEMARQGRLVKAERGYYYAPAPEPPKGKKP